MTNIVQSSNRPWGKFEVLSAIKEKDSDHQEIDIVEKKITVLPQKRLSLQTHKNREEIWLIVSGEGEVVIGEVIARCAKGSVFNVPKGVIHRISNTSDSEPLIFLETARGDFDEGDIIRIEDDFGRK